MLLAGKEIFKQTRQSHGTPAVNYGHPATRKLLDYFLLELRQAVAALPSRHDGA